MFQTNVVHKIKTHILCSMTFFQKSYHSQENYGKTLQIRTGHRWQYNKMHAPCMLDN